MSGRSRNWRTAEKLADGEELAGGGGISRREGMAGEVGIGGRRRTAGEWRGGVLKECAAKKMRCRFLGARGNGGGGV
ncbi:MAG: hypothetical protein ACR2P5_05595 [Gammaproteobacteria bacterium]